MKIAAINIDLPPKTRGLTAIAGATSLIAVLLIVQIWLDAYTREMLAIEVDTSLPSLRVVRVSHRRR
jgi:hypothetical protein